MVLSLAAVGWCGPTISASLRCVKPWAVRRSLRILLLSKEDEDCQAGRASGFQIPCTQHLTPLTVQTSGLLIKPGHASLEQSQSLLRSHLDPAVSLHQDHGCTVLLG